MNSRPIFYVPVHGTWAIDEQETAWWKPSGAFAQYAQRHNVIQSEHVGVPFIWSSDISGFKYNLASGNAKHTDWRAGGWSLYYYLRQLPLEARNLIIHSHGLQPVLYCALYGMQINNIVTVCSPIRNDMLEVAEAARFKINKWLHIYDNSDWIQFAGQFGDGRFFGSRKSPHATENQLLKDINHADVLKIGARMDYWVTRGWFDFLRQ